MKGDKKDALDKDKSMDMDGGALGADTKRTAV